MTSIPISRFFAFFSTRYSFFCLGAPTMAFPRPSFPAWQELLGHLALGYFLKSMPLVAGDIAWFRTLYQCCLLHLGGVILGVSQAPIKSVWSPSRPHTSSSCTFSGRDANFLACSMNIVFCAPRNAVAALERIRFAFSKKNLCIWSDFDHMLCVGFFSINYKAKFH